MKITIFDDPTPQGNRPHKKGFVTVGESEYEFAVWPAKSGKANTYTGALKPKGSYVPKAPE